MRSRYVAYALGAVSHIMATTATDSPHYRPDTSAWREELLVWCQQVQFRGLSVLASSQEEEVGFVRFFASLHTDGRDVSFGENSRFVRRDGRWLYVSDAALSEEA